MADYLSMNRDELTAEKAALEAQYKKFQDMGLKLNMARGKPGPHQMDLPGFKKEEISISLEDGNLTIQAAKGLDEDEKEKKSGRYIRRERYAGSCARSFYVGDDITEEDIKAEFKHGILKIFVPKKEAKPEVEQKKYIAIEG